MYFHLISNNYIKFLNNYFYKNLLHYACEAGNIDLVKYLVSLNQIDIFAKIFKMIFFLFCFINLKV